MASVTLQFVEKYGPPIGSKKYEEEFKPDLTHLLEVARAEAIQKWIADQAGSAPNGVIRGWLTDQIEVTPMDDRESDGNPP